MKSHWWLVLAVLLPACGGGKKASDDGGVSGDRVTRVGKIAFKMKLPMPAELDAAEVQPHVATLEQAGVTVAADLSEVSFGSIPKGWPIKIGDAITWVDDDGTFTIEFEDDGSVTEWTLYDPTVEPYATHPWASGSVADLVAEGSTPTAVEIDILFGGGCGMDPVEDDEGDSGAHCAMMSGNVAPKSPEKGHEGHHHTTNPTGNETTCLDDDGPVFTGEGKHSWKRFLAYVGSTCHGFVLEGCCVGEGGTVAEFLDLDPSGKACPEVHHGRQCQELSLNDMVVGGAENIDVALGESIDFNVHNNGCFGYTVVTKVDRFPPLGGTLSSPNLDGYQLKHWDDGGSAKYYNMTYQVDRTMSYELPTCMREDKIERYDQWEFRVNTARTSKVFRVKKENLYIFTAGSQNGQIFSADRWPISPPEEGCPGMQHVHGINPCTGSSNEEWPEGECGHGPVEPWTGG